MFPNKWTETNCDKGIVDEVLRPKQEWRVKVHGVYWHALSKADFNFSPGDYVQVVGRNNLKLLISPIKQCSVVIPA